MISGKKGEDLRTKHAGALEHRQVSAFVQEDDLGRESLSPVSCRLGVYDLVLLTGDDEDGNLYDSGLAGEPAPRGLAAHHVKGLARSRRGGLARVVYALFVKIFRVKDERAHPEPTQGPQKTP